MGVMDEPIVLGRLGDPPCDTLIEGFTTLTGHDPINRCD